MKNRIRATWIAIVLLGGSLSSYAQTLSSEIPLWDTPPTESNGLTGPETEVGTQKFTANVNVPTVRIYRANPACHTGAAVLILPSGGHGWGFRDTFAYHERMKTLVLEWIRPFTEPLKQK